MPSIWHLPDWPALRWDAAALTRPLAQTRHRQGRLLGRMQALGFPLQQQASLQALTQDVLKTSDIEGERLDAEQVRSSLARRLGIDIGALTPADRHVEGIVQVTLDATQNHAAALMQKRLSAWHAQLFPAGSGSMQRLRVGAWRDDHDGPMQVVSGAVGRERVHYVPPPADRLPAEMRHFLHWFNAAPGTDPVLHAAEAHFRFVTIHPFEDGNGRLARAIADMALARSDSSAQRFYSMSAQIRAERATYYALLERMQRGDGDITDWMLWFLACLDRAIGGAETMLAGVLRKARFWEAHAALPLNQRQRDMLNRLLDGFEGKLTSSKWAKLTKSSQDTAGRDIAALVQAGLLRLGEGGGRSTHYTLAVPD